MRPQVGGDALSCGLARLQGSIGGKPIRGEMWLAILISVLTKDNCLGLRGKLLSSFPSHPFSCSVEIFPSPRKTASTLRKDS